MDFLDIFSLRDVFFAATGLVIVSIIRIYYDSYSERKKVERFGNSLGIYNNTLECQREGLLILSDSNKIIFSTMEVGRLLETNVGQLTTELLRNTLIAQEEDSDNPHTLLQLIRTAQYLPHAVLLRDSDRLPISVSTHTIKVTAKDSPWHVLVIRDMTTMHELREGAKELLSLD